MSTVITVVVDIFAGIGVLITALFIAGVFASRRRKNNR